MASRDTLIDGDFSRAQEVGAPRWYYPFRSLGDRSSCYFEQDYWQTDSTWVPQEMATEHPTMRGFYLISETDRQSTIAGIVSFTRVYSRIPIPQVTYSSRSITKPTVSTQYVNPLGSSFSATFNVSSSENIFAPIGTAAVNQTGFFCTDNRVFAPFKTNIIKTVQNAGSGTFTVTYKTSTTAPIAYNASDATVTSDINGLAAIISDGVTVSAFNSLSTGGTSAGALAVRISIGAPSINDFSIDVSSLSVSTAGVPAKAWLRYETSPFIQYNFSLSSVLTIVSHGFSSTASLLIGYGGSTPNAYIFDQWEVYDSNTIRYQDLNGSTSATMEYVAPYLRTYTPGAVILSCRVTDRFYLPRVSSGVSSPGDIPISSPSISDQDIISAVLENGTFTAVAFDGPSQWMGSAMWKTTTTEMDFSSL